MGLGRAPPAPPGRGGDGGQGLGGATGIRTIRAPPRRQDLSALRSRSARRGADWSRGCPAVRRSMATPAGPRASAVGGMLEVDDPTPEAVHAQQLEGRAEVTGKRGRAIPDGHGGRNGWTSSSNPAAIAWRARVEPPTDRQLPAVRLIRRTASGSNSGSTGFWRWTARAGLSSRRSWWRPPDPSELKGAWVLICDRNERLSVGHRLARPASGAMGADPPLEGVGDGVRPGPGAPQSNLPSASAV